MVASDTTLNPDLKSSPQPAGFETGALIPKDMTVRLVRADAAAWEIFLSLLYTFVLTAFGIFLGAWITDSHQSCPSFSMLEKAATVILGIVAAILGIAWLVLKVRQNQKTLKIPLSLLTAQDATP
ncbi:MAG: hypothetical protein QOK24_728 [Verrucomicrobiota bacterium]|jgi:uncharacterized membrane protein